MKISVLAGIVLGLALLLVSVGVMANFGVIARPLSPEELARKRVAELEQGKPDDIHEDTTLELTENSVDFGKLEEGIERVHEFVIKNTGRSDLRLSGIRPSCSCIFIKEDRLQVAPGQSGTLHIGIKTKDLYGPVEKYVLFQSNGKDQHEISIQVNAVVMRALEMSPPKVTFSRLLASESASQEVKVYAQHTQPFEIKGFRFMRPEIEKFFDVTFRPLETAELPEEAKSGWLVTVNVKPGLPTGTFRQFVNLETSFTQQDLDTSIEVEGNVVNDISVVAIGADFDPRYNLLTLGPLKQAQGGTAHLKMLVSGAFRDTLELGTPTCDPKFLKVTAGERKSINNGSASEIPIEIEVPPESPVVSLLGNTKAGAGVVVIPTNHSSMKEVRILVNFAVEK